MWEMTLRILAIIGIILLILLGIFLLLILAVLFCPVVYRARGEKTPEKMWLWAKVSWLFGVLRVRYAYPDPGKLTVKLLWKTVFDSSAAKEKKEKEPSGKGGAKKAKREKKASDGLKEKAAEEARQIQSASDGTKEKAAEEARQIQSASDGTKEKAAEEARQTQSASDGIEEKAGEVMQQTKSASDGLKEKAAEEARQTQNASGQAKDEAYRRTRQIEGSAQQGEGCGEGGDAKDDGDTEDGGKLPEKDDGAKRGAAGETSGTSDCAEAAQEPGQESGTLGKIAKLKYTILKLCDKIREIWENISYYVRLLREDNTVKLWEHVKLRLAKIGKSIRPRHIRAEVLFGAASPDTTGYLYGVYCMFSPALGSKVSVTPDFTRAVLQGKADVSGHITGAVLLWNALRLLLDRKLHLFLKKMKTGRRQDGR